MSPPSHPPSTVHGAAIHLSAVPLARCTQPRPFFFAAFPLSLQSPVNCCCYREKDEAEGDAARLSQVTGRTRRADMSPAQRRAAESCDQRFPSRLRQPFEQQNNYYFPHIKGTVRGCLFPQGFLSVAADVSAQSHVLKTVLLGHKVSRLQDESIWSLLAAKLN